MKRSTAWATATGKKKPGEAESRWLMLSPLLNSTTQIDSLLNLYWGGPERRITGITLRIIGVNALALLVLMLGILYLSQYQGTLIKARLETFQSELELIALALSEGATTDGKNTLSTEATRKIIEKLEKKNHQRLRVFNAGGTLIADSKDIFQSTAQPGHTENGFNSVQFLKNIVQLIFTLLPDREILLTYPAGDPAQALTHPDVLDALKGSLSLSLWQGEGSKILFSAAAPLNNDKNLLGAVLITRQGHDIEEEITDIWFNILKIFILTLVLTITMSIYLSGTIARPLKKLARAAEAVRKGQARAEDIPDLSRRHDEIGELSLALRQMTQALWERMDAIEHFAADVSHELKNPLTSLRSAVETLEVAKTAKDRQKLLNIIRHDLQRLNRLITDIATASRLDSELSKEEPEEVDLKILLVNLLEAYADPLKRHATKQDTRQNTSLWRHTINGGDITITLDTGETGENALTWGLEGRLAQVFQNLLTNAMSFSPKGGTIAIKIRAEERLIAITIEDEGPGIPESRLESIFERFYSERPLHEDYGQHSGLGLSICRQIITAHGGRIFAKNIRGTKEKARGARFTVLLNKATHTERRTG
ncbi:MAG: sensor N-terminal transmembrane domain-containing protein [Alphaproteobacteria bacterium]|nr:sensor N-terminal transmembrane domain-containing protein [Alphaproteobacteria bacterium]